MDVRWLEDFLSLAATRSFVRSAEERHVSQAAFGRRIKAIEAWVGVPLIDRSEYPVRLTSHGVLFKDAAAAAVRTLSDARAVLRGAAGATHAVSIATGKSLALNFVPAWFESLRGREPELNASVVTTAMPDGALMLVEGGIDFLLSYWNDEVPLLLDATEFEHHTVGHECLVPACVPNGSGGPRWPLGGDATAPAPWLRVAENTRQGRVVSALIDAHGYRLSPVYEADFSEALVDVALRGLGVAWLSERAIESHVARGRLVRAAPPAADARFDIRLYRRIGNRTAAADRLWRAATR